MSQPSPVAALLAVAGFSPPPEELAELEQSHLLLVDMVASLYAVERARYESPALVFDPRPQFADWD